MPLIKPSGFHTPYYLRNGNLQTIIPNIFRKIKVSFFRERIITPDDDFLDLDWLYRDSKKLAIITHGLEGGTDSLYIKGMASHFHNYGWEVLAWNFRSCSGEINKRLRFYHSGETGDLQTIIDYASSKKVYNEIVLIGFSLGGNITLKYVGEQGANINPLIKKAVAFSVPCHLEDSAYKMNKGFSKVYLHRFLRSLKAKILTKHSLMPDKINIDGIDKLNDFHAFDNRYTSVMHGFRDAHDYYTQCSSIQFMHRIAIPTLLVNADDDPFLSQSSYPVQEAINNPNLSLEITRSGGHVGFMGSKLNGVYWSEKRALEFCTNQTHEN